MFAAKRAVVVASVVLATTTACSAPAEPVPSGEGSIFDQMIVEATEADASASQLELLKQSRDAGRVDFATVQEALESTFRCFEEANIPYQRGTASEHEGLLLQHYSFGEAPEVSPEESLALADACLTRESYFVESAYQLQPSSVEAKGRYFDEHTRSRLTACLIELGFQVTENSSRDELMTTYVDEVTRRATAAQENGGMPLEKDCLSGGISGLTDQP